MRLNFKILSLSIFFLLNNCTMTLQSFFEALNYSKNSVDFLSFITTDKTTTDHGLSYLFRKDCTLTRALKFKKICQEINKKDLITYNEYLNLNKTKKVYKKKVVRIKKINVPSMAYPISQIKLNK